MSRIQETFWGENMGHFLFFPYMSTNISDIYVAQTSFYISLSVSEKNRSPPLLGTGTAALTNSKEYLEAEPGFLPVPLQSSNTSVNWAKHLLSSPAMSKIQFFDPFPWKSVFKWQQFTIKAILCSLDRNLLFHVVCLCLMNLCSFVLLNWHCICLYKESCFTASLKRNKGVDISMPWISNSSISWRRA